MVTTEYKIAYSEILEILKHISKKEQEKVPSNMIEMFKANASKNSNFAYNPKKTLQEQNVSEIAISIIAILYRDYWTTKEQRQKILNYQNREREKYKAEKYDVNNIFKKKNYCFYYPVVEPKIIYLKFNDINYNNEIIDATIDTYLYMPSFDSMEFSKIENNFIESFNAEKYSKAKNILINELYGEYKRKNIKFKINNNGKFFKYQIISIKTLDN